MSLLSEGLEVFAVIFLFEIVDRTNFAIVGLAGKHPPRDVWVGAAGAFAVSSVISVGIGLAALTYLPAYLVWIRVVGGIVLIAFGLRSLLKDEEKEVEEAEARFEPTPARSKVWATAFALVLFLEMGDNTQILTFEFVAAAGSSPGTALLLVILVSAMLALWSVASIGATAGRFLRERIPAEQLERLLGGILVVVGVLTILVALFPQVFPAL